jgi:hypothetical protein
VNALHLRPKDPEDENDSEGGTGLKPMLQ